MAEVVSLVLETFRDLLLEEGKFLFGVGSEVKALQTQLTEIKCLLKDVDKKRHESEMVRNWVVEIRDLAYRAEDSIASYAVEISSDSLGRGVKRLLGGFLSVLHSRSLNSEISDIKSELNRVTKSLQEYGIRKIVRGEESSENQIWARKIFPSFEIGDCFVGKEEDLRRLGFLIGDDKQHRVISVWGIGGIGKTTVAKKVFDKMLHSDKFDCFAWVCITQQCQIQAVLEGVFKQLDQRKGEGVSSLGEEQLIEQLCLIQREKRCLIVLDDLWEISHWNGLKHAFVVEDLKSKILVTTRKQNVAEIGLSMELGLLNMDEAQELLMKKSFPHGKYPDFAMREKLHEIGKEMVRKCGFLPLAISLLGGVLSKKNSLREWELVNAKISSSIYRGEGHIEQVLNLSYQDLPYFLKPCFLYLAKLREDEIIHARDLYSLWIAQGMISYKNFGPKEETLMEIAELYLNELASRCIVQVEFVVEDGSIPTLKFDACKLHDVVRELCVSIGTDENFGVQILEYKEGRFSTLLKEALSGNKTRHLVMHFERDFQIARDDLETVSEEYTSACKHLRSLEIRSHVPSEFPSQSILDLQKFKMLKSLVIVGFKFRGRKLPRAITNLVHLKYLCVQDCELDKLPPSLSNLAYLETLLLYPLWNVRVPNVLKKMLRLKRLLLPCYDTKTIGNHRMTLDVGDELETLLWFDSSVYELVSITKMKNLRGFSAFIRDNESLSTIINAIAIEWTKLQYCMISIEQGCELTSEEGQKKLKQVLACPNVYCLQIAVRLGKQLAECESDIISSKLVNLNLEDCRIEDDPMEILGKIPTLKYLRLHANSFVGEELTCPPLSFPHLKILVLSHLQNWREWRLEEGAMPLLFEITINDCPRFEKLPNGLSCISSLRELKILGMPVLGKRVLESGEDFHKVCHVPSIFIHNYSQSTYAIPNVLFPFSTFSVSQRKRKMVECVKII